MIRRLAESFGDRMFQKTFIAGLLMLLASVFVNYFAGVYAQENASNPVTDIILSNIPVFQNAGFFFVFGPIAFFIVILGICLYDPKRAPFILKSIALFVLIRSVFITLTHIGPFPDYTIGRAPNLLQYFTFGGDLFFSGHTGLPFLMALIFYRNKILFWIFSISSVFFGVIVLLAHLHYSIDVLSAFFITYTIYHIAKWLFAEDAHLFETGLPAVVKIS